MSWVVVIVKQKNPPRINGEGRWPIILSSRTRKQVGNRCGEGLLIPSTFRCKHKFNVLLRTMNKNGNSLPHPIGLQHPHHRRFMYFSPFATGLLSHPQEQGIPHSKDSTNKEFHKNFHRNLRLKPYLQIKRFVCERIEKLVPQHNHIKFIRWLLLSISPLTN